MGAIEPVPGSEGFEKTGLDDVFGFFGGASHTAGDAIEHGQFRLDLPFELSGELLPGQGSLLGPGDGSGVPGGAEDHPRW